jgi:hypothetical protein
MRSTEVAWHGEKRSNDTHQSTTDPEARLARKSFATAAKMSYAGDVRSNRTTSRSHVRLCGPRSVRTCTMAFGQSSGPPATGKQVRELLDLLAAAGHSDFRDARGPMGFSQRQASGKFTRDEAEAFINLLESEIHGDGPPTGTGPASAARAPVRATTSRSSRPGGSSAELALEDVPAEVLAAELQRRGWVVLEP